MKSLLILGAGSLALFGSLNLSAQIPVIISQPTTVTVCDGDSVTLEIIAEGECTLQWFTAQNTGAGYYNYIEIPGEKFYRLTRNPVHASGIYYLLRLAGTTDTIWSAGIKVTVQIPQKPIADTLFVNHVPGYARLFDGFMVTNLQLIWSTGDTSDFPSQKTYVRFESLGKNWVKTIQNGCARTDTFVVAECPHILHIDSITPAPKCWCADTVYIDRDVSPGVITVAPGTTIKFTGDYYLSSGYMDARGADRDSIVIEGYFDPVMKKWQGWLHSHNLSPQNYRPTTFESTLIKHMDLVQLFRAGSATFYRNNLVEYYDAGRCFFHQNKRVNIIYTATSSVFLENDSVFGKPSPFPRGAISFFYFLGNTFKSNKSGLIIQNDNTIPFYNGPTHIFNCTFSGNASTAITSRARINYIDQNIFTGNGSGSEGAVFHGDFRKVVFSGDTYDHQLVIRNNTLYNNYGTANIGIDLSDSAAVGGCISNNIFSNLPEMEHDIRFSEKCLGLFKICHNSFEKDSSTIMAQADTNLVISQNLFSTKPDFSGKSAGDFSLSDSSILIDKGMDIEHGPVMHDLYFTEDFRGFPRKTGLAIDPGAYEYHAIVPLAFQYVTPDTVVCDRDTITLKAIPEGGYDESHFVFAWYRNGTKIWDSNLPYLTIESVIPSDTAYYEAEMTNGTDTLRSGPIHLSVLQKPDLSLQPGYQLACAGMDLTLRVTRLQSLTDYWWTSAKDGPFNQPTPVLNLPNVVENDTLIITATNACGSAQSGPIILKIAPLPDPFLGADTTLHVGDSLLLDAGEGVRYTWRSGETGAQIYGYPNDTSWVSVTNAYGCTGGDTLVILMIPSSMKEYSPENLKIILYPNPAHERFFIRIPENLKLPCRLQVISMDGEMLSVQEILTSGEFETVLGKLMKGTYIIRLDTGSAIYTGKITLK